MLKIWLVFKNEFLMVVFRRSFILSLVMVPLIGFIVSLVIANANQSQNSNAITELFSTETKITMEGYVDPGNLIKTVPEDVSSKLRKYADEASAKQALASGEIDGYYWISPDYTQTGKVIYVSNDFNPMSGLTRSGMIEYALNVSLLGGNSTLVSLVRTPLNLETMQIAEGNPSTENGPATDKAARDPDNPLTFFMPYSVTLLFYIVIMGGSTLMLNSITNEKQNRVMEVLMTSITPTQMLTGKMIALGLIGLLQTLIWSGAGFLILRLGGKSLNIPVTFQLPASILVWGGVFFVLGYGIYAGLMAGVGALVPNLREASQATFILIIPLLIPLMFIGILIEQPNGTLAVALSLIPLTSPVVMMTRLSSGGVPWWQLALAVALLLASDWLVVRSISGMFRAQILLSGNTFNIRLFLKAMAGKS